MNILICVFGTLHGDLGPCLSIARELVRRGHRVTVASHESYREMVAEQGIAFIGTLPAMTREEGALWFEYATQSNMKEWKYLARLVTRHSEFNVNRISEGANFDILLCSQGTLFAPLLAQKLGIPWGSLVYQPIAIPPEFTRFLILGRTWRINFLRRIMLPEFIAKAIYFFGACVLYFWIAPLRRAGQSLGLPSSGLLSFGKNLLGSPYFNIALFSSVFAKLGEDPPQPLIQAGFVGERCGGRLVSSRMTQFLENGDPPLLFSFGTFAAATTKGKKLLDTAVETCVATNRRAIFIVGKIWDLRMEQLGDQFFVSEYEPFPMLLPHVSLIVHIGGMGTVSAALRAGVAQLILPFSYEQCDNALRLQDMGLARTLPVARCNLFHLTREIELASAESCRKLAAEVRAEIEEEDGAATVVDYLERLS
jgi:UDP:flavonoid glycosyltransferase YjiC (YdhE family)